MELQFIGHSAFYLETENAGILVDPFISESPVAKFDPSSKIDDIFVTHAHADHLGDAIPLSKKTGATITAIYELANYCIKRGATAQGVNVGGKLSFPWGSAKIFSAAHSSSTLDGAYAGCPCSIMLEIDEVKIYFAGDTGLHQDMKMVGEFFKPDIAALPVGDIFTMGIEEAAIAAKWLGVKKVIPIHYKSFDVLKADTEELKKLLPSGVELVILEPGQKIKF